MKNSLNIKILTRIEEISAICTVKSGKRKKKDFNFRVRPKVREKGEEKWGTERRLKEDS